MRMRMRMFVMPRRMRLLERGNTQNVAKDREPTTGRKKSIFLPKFGFTKKMDV
jgi:hypothetical protein